MRIGRLFWKLLVVLWFSMSVSIAGTGLFLHFAGHAHPVPPPDLASRPWPEQAQELVARSGPGAMGVNALPPQGSALPVPWPPIISGALASLITSMMFAWYLSRPLHHLRWALHQVAQGRLDTRVHQHMGTRRDEITDLARDFDRMVEELQKLTESRERLLHHVSHELRSPIARMQAAIGVLRQSPDRLFELIERIERDGHRLDMLLEEVLTLHRLESRAKVTESMRVDVVELLHAVVEDADFEARVTGKAVALDAPQPFVASVHGELVCRAFENVIRNAVKFSPSGGCIEVHARVGVDGALWCSVLDRGPGVTDHMLEAMFMPFVRAETTPPADSASGTGLGLAIARRALLVHGGSICAQHRLGGGLEVQMCLPAQASTHLYPA
jgi:two-component system OmpR family sensor kinase